MFSNLWPEFTFNNKLDFTHRLELDFFILENILYNRKVKQLQNVITANISIHFQFLYHLTDNVKIFISASQFSNFLLKNLHCRVLLTLFLLLKHFSSDMLLICNGLGLRVVGGLRGHFPSTPFIFNANVIDIRTHSDLTLRKCLCSCLQRWNNCVSMHNYARSIESFSLSARLFSWTI